MIDGGSAENLAVARNFTQWVSTFAALQNHLLKKQKVSESINSASVGEKAAPPYFESSTSKHHDRKGEESSCL